MLFYIWLIQIVVYLFAVPATIATLSSDTPHNLRAFLVAGLFLATFLIGHHRFIGTKPAVQKYRAVHSFTDFGRMVVILWCVAHVMLCLQYELYDRRIGTENAAVLFAGIPALQLLVIRSLEIFLPYLLAISLYGFTADRSPLRFLVPVAIGASLAVSGVANSRSALIVLGVSIIVLLQNLTTKRSRRLLFLGVGIIGVSVAATVTVWRMASEGEADVRYYAESQFLKRLDGLEVVATLIESDGVRAVGQNPEVLLLPLIAAIPLSSQATEVKELALTTVKANILEREFASSERDINSFAITDVYYIGGIIGVALIGFLLGKTARLVDDHLGATRSRILHLLLVAVVCNGFMLERETTGILITVVRDWLLLTFLMFFVCRWNLSTVVYAIAPRRPPVEAAALAGREAQAATQ